MSVNELDKLIKELNAELITIDGNISDKRDDLESTPLGNPNIRYDALKEGFEEYRVESERQRGEVSRKLEIAERRYKDITGKDHNSGEE